MAICFCRFQKWNQEINPVDGAVVHEYEKGKSTDYMCVTSEYLIVITDGDVHYGDVASGKPADGGDAIDCPAEKLLQI